MPLPPLASSFVPLAVLLLGACVDPPDRASIAQPDTSDAPQPIVPRVPLRPAVTLAEMHDMTRLCDPGHQTGTFGPIAVCNPNAPCPDGSTTSSTPPACPASTMLVSWQDSVIDTSNVDESGIPHPDARYACAPDEAPNANSEPVPLLVYFTPSGTSADVIYWTTWLAGKAASWIWSYATPSGKPATGFVLVVAQARNLQLGAGGAGVHEDESYRPPQIDANPDVRNADALVDWAIAHYAGRIDPRRIYVTGWSNGAVFGQLYAIARHPSTHLAVLGSTFGSPTPAGHYVAAAAVFSGNDPFAGMPSGDCGTRVYPTTRVPIYLAHRSCDLVPCEETQQQCFFGFATASYRATTGASTSLAVEPWLAELTAPAGWHAMGDSAVIDTVLDIWSNHLAPGAASCVASAGGPNDGQHCLPFASWLPSPAADPTPHAVTSVPATSSGCTPIEQGLEHLLWPASDEPNMLAFLGAHALP